MHYCAALILYQRELAVKYRELSVFICIDDKHRIEVGKPGYPVAAVERGRQVIVSQTEESLLTMISLDSRSFLVLCYK